MYRHAAFRCGKPVFVVLLYQNGSENIPDKRKNPAAFRRIFRGKHKISRTPRRFVPAERLPPGGRKVVLSRGKAALPGRKGGFVLTTLRFCAIVVIGILFGGGVKIGKEDLRDLRKVQREVSSLL